MLIDWLESCWLLVNYFISCLDSHSDGTHLLQMIHCWASDVMLHFYESVPMKKQTHLHLGLRGNTFSANVNFWLNYICNAYKILTHILFFLGPENRLNYVYSKYIFFLILGWNMTYCRCIPDRFYEIHSYIYVYKSIYLSLPLSVSSLSSTT